MAVESMGNPEGWCPGLDVHLDRKVAVENGKQRLSSCPIPSFYLLNIIFSKLIKGEKELLSNLTQK